MADFRVLCAWTVKTLTFSVRQGCKGGCYAAILGTRDEFLQLGHYAVAGQDRPSSSAKCRTLKLLDRSVYCDSVHRVSLYCQRSPSWLRNRSSARPFLIFVLIQSDMMAAPQSGGGFAPILLFMGL